MKRHRKLGFLFLLSLPSLIALALSGCGRPEIEDDEEIAPRLSRTGDQIVYRGIGAVPLNRARELNESQVRSFANQALGSLQNNLGYFQSLGVSPSYLSPFQPYLQSPFFGGGVPQATDLTHNALLAQACRLNLEKILRNVPNRRREIQWRAERCLAIHSTNQLGFSQYVQPLPQPQMNGVLNVLITLLLGAG